MPVRFLSLHHMPSFLLPQKRLLLQHTRLLRHFLFLSAMALILLGCQVQGEMDEPLAIVNQAETAPSGATALPATYTPTPAATATPAPQTAPEASKTPAGLEGGSAKTTPTTAPLLAPTPGPTVSPDLALEYAKIGKNQFLSNIAARQGVTVDAIAKQSGIENPDLVGVGQGIIIPHRATVYTPDAALLPDSELVYGPAYVDFDIAEFVRGQPGYLASYSMVNELGEIWTGADLIERIALRFSGGPRVLLALMEARSGWVTDPEPSAYDIERPLGHRGGPGNLLIQLEWAANELNMGFYGWQDRGETAIRFHDGVVARGAPGLNPGTVAVQRVLARDSNFADIAEELAAFSEAYERLFGAPDQYDAGPALPAGLEQPALQLPWAQGELWYLSGGPHGGWGGGSGWAALDFVPADAVPGSCIPSESWATAATAGIVARNDRGELLIDLDGDGDVRTGWVLQYLHLTDRVDAGKALQAGDPVGRPACDGGAAISTHLHISRRYNGLWVAAAGPVPFDLGGWRATGGFAYEGGMIGPNGEERTACECRDEGTNGLTW